MRRTIRSEFVQRVVGLAAVAALVFVAYRASASDPRAQAVRPVPASVMSGQRAHRMHPVRPVPDAEVVIGHPRDGIVELPAHRRSSN
jgi:hypothetical protein